MTLSNARVDGVIGRYAYAPTLATVRLARGREIDAACGQLAALSVAISR